MTQQHGLPAARLAENHDVLSALRVGDSNGNPTRLTFEQRGAKLKARAEGQMLGAPSRAVPKTGNELFEKLSHGRAFSSWLAMNAAFARQESRALKPRRLRRLG